MNPCGIGLGLSVGAGDGGSMRAVSAMELEGPEEHATHPSETSTLAIIEQRRPSVLK